MNWKSIKVKEDVYRMLKNIGGGSIKKAIELLLKTQQKRIEEKFAEISEVGRELAELLFRYGIFSIKIVGGNIENISQSGNYLKIKGYITLYVPDSELRTKIFDLIKSRLGGEEVEN